LAVSNLAAIRTHSTLGLILFREAKTLNTNDFQRETISVRDLRAEKSDVPPFILFSGCFLLTIGFTLLRLPVPPRLKGVYYAVTLVPYIGHFLLTCFAKGLPVTFNVNTIILIAYFFVITVLGTAMNLSFRATALSVAGLARLVGPPIVVVTVSLFLYAMATTTNNERVRKAYLFSFFLGLQLFVASNITLHHLGFERLIGRNDFTGNGTIATLLGLSIKRASPPLCVGPGTFGQISAILLFWSVSYLSSRNSGNVRRVFAGPGVLISAYALLLADSRVAAFSVLLLLVLWARQSLMLMFVRYGILSAFVAIPFLIILTFPLLDQIHRAGERSTGFTRASVWTASALKMTEPNINTILGYGLEGNVNAELSQLNSELIAWRVDGASPTSHNFFLQNAIDFGIVGLIVICCLVQGVSRRLLDAIDVSRDTLLRAEYVMLTLMLVALMFGGCTESTPSYYSMELMLVFIYVMQFGLFL